jgi:aryl-alcohol dehydrogenase-like predicted oxidoreductase
MKYAALGKTGIHVSRICLGTMLFGNPLREDECLRLVAAALDSGSIVSTRPMYTKVTTEAGVPRVG